MTTLAQAEVDMVDAILERDHPVPQERIWRSVVVWTWDERDGLLTHEVEWVFMGGRLVRVRTRTRAANS